MNNKNGLLKPKSTLSEEGTMPFHEFRAVPLLHRCLNPSDGNPEKAS